MKFKYSDDVSLEYAINNLGLYVAGGNNFYSRVVCGRTEFGERKEGLRDRPHIKKELILDGHISKDGVIKFSLIIHIKEVDTFGTGKIFKLDTMDLKKAVDIFNKVLSVDDDIDKLQEAE